MTKIFKTFLILTTLLLVSTAHARVLSGLIDRNGNPVHSGDEFTLHINTTITQDPYGYRYTYDITNDVLSNQAVWMFDIIFNDSYSMIQGSSNSSWGKGSEPNPLAQGELWAKGVRWLSDPDMLSPPPLAPNQTLRYTFVSPYPPSTIKAYAEGNTNYPWYDSAPAVSDEYDLLTPYGPGKVFAIIGPVKPTTPNVTDNYSVIGCTGGLCDVQLDITGPQDPYGTAYTYTWTGAFGTATGAKPLVQLSAGTYQVSVAVSDPYATLVTATMPITVVDPNPPTGGGNQGGGQGNVGGGNAGGGNAGGGNAGEGNTGGGNAGGGNTGGGNTGGGNAGGGNAGGGNTGGGNTGGGNTGGGNNYSPYNNDDSSGDASSDNQSDDDESDDHDDSESN